MNPSIRLSFIPEEHYSEYRYQTIFKAYKWDPQVGDHNTVANQVLLMEEETAKQLELWAEQLSQETIQMEEAFLDKPSLAKQLGLPKKIIKALKQITRNSSDKFTNSAVSKTASYDMSQNVRLMRFDFHPTSDGWAVSEVNSDVPGGLAEASVLPRIACQYFNGYQAHKNIAQSLYEAFLDKTSKEATIAFVHATSYADDRQVMEFLSDYFIKQGYQTVLAAPDHITWNQGKAYCNMDGNVGPIDGITRFFPLEWLTNLPKSSDWRGYYTTATPSCNHPIAIYTQSKRLPLVWDELGVNISTWKQLLPRTIDPKLVHRNDSSWIYKPALGRVGEGISIREAITEKERLKIEKSVRKHPRDWVAQQKFTSQPLINEKGEHFHLCVGVFTVNGKSAGFYGRISPYARIDDRAKDIPILVKGRDKDER